MSSSIGDTSARARKSTRSRASVASTVRPRASYVPPSVGSGSTRDESIAVSSSSEEDDAPASRSAAGRPSINRAPAPARRDEDSGSDVEMLPSPALSRINRDSSVSRSSTGDTGSTRPTPPRAGRNQQQQQQQQGEASKSTGGRSAGDSFKAPRAPAQASASPTVSPPRRALPFAVGGGRRVPLATSTPAVTATLKRSSLAQDAAALGAGREKRRKSVTVEADASSESDEKSEDGDEPALPPPLKRAAPREETENMSDDSLPDLPRASAVPRAPSRASRASSTNSDAAVAASLQPHAQPWPQPGRRDRQMDDDEEDARTQRGRRQPRATGSRVQVQNMSSSDEYDDEEEQRRPAPGPGKGKGKGKGKSVPGVPLQPSRNPPPSSISNSDEEESDERDEPVRPGPGLGKGKGKGKGKGRAPAAIYPTGPGKGKGKSVPRPQPSSRVSDSDSDSDEDESSSISSAQAERNAAQERDRRSRSVTTRSTSHRGYTWERESTLMSPGDIKERLSFVEDTVVTVERHGKEHEFFLKRDDAIWILPDPRMLPAREGDIAPQDLPDEDWWAAKILDVGLLRQDDGDPMAVLKVAWYYDADHTKSISSIHKEDRAKLLKYRFGQREMIRSDHHDFIGTDSYAGKAAVYSYLNLLGLTVPDEDILKPAHLRKLRATKTTRMNGWTTRAQDVLRKRKAAAERKAEC